MTNWDFMRCIGATASGRAWLERARRGEVKGEALRVGGRKMQVEIDERELGTILAALRHWQETSCRGELLDIATDGGRLGALTSGEVDALCERINTGRDGEPTVGRPVFLATLGTVSPPQLKCPQCGEGLLFISSMICVEEYVAQLSDDGHPVGRKLGEKHLDWEPVEFKCSRCDWTLAYRLFLKKIGEIQKGGLDD